MLDRSAKIEITGQLSTRNDAIGQADREAQREARLLVLGEVFTQIKEFICGTMDCRRVHRLRCPAQPLI